MLTAEQKYQALSVSILAGMIAVVCLLGSIACIYHTLHPNSHPDILSFASILIGLVVAVIGLILARLVVLPRKPVLVLLVIGLSLRVIAVFSIHNQQVSDFAIYHELGTSIYNGTGLSYTGPVGLSGDVSLFMNDDRPTVPKRTAFRLPGLPFLLSTIYHIAGPYPLAGKLLNAVLGALCGVLLFLLLKPWHRSAFVIACLWEIYPASIVATTVLCTEIPFTAALLLTACLIAMATNRPYQIWWTIGAGLCLGATCLIRPATQLLIAAPLALLFIPATIRWRILLITVTLISASVPLGIWAMRNYVQFGKGVINPTEQGITVFVITRELTGVPNTRALDSMESVYFHTTDEFDKARLGTAIGLQRFLISVKNGHIYKRLPLNFLKGWRDDTDFVNWAFEAPCLNGQWTPAKNAESVALLISRAAYLALLILGFVGGVFILLRKIKIDNPGVLMLMFNFAGSAVLIVLFEGQPRYHFSLVPTICMLAGFAMCPVTRLKRQSMQSHS